MLPQGAGRFEDIVRRRQERLAKKLEGSRQSDLPPASATTEVPESRVEENAQEAADRQETPEGQGAREAEPSKRKSCEGRHKSSHSKKRKVSSSDQLPDDVSGRSQEAQPQHRPAKRVCSQLHLQKSLTERYGADVSLSSQDVVEDLIPDLMFPADTARLKEQNDDEAFENAVAANFEQLARLLDLGNKVHTYHGRLVKEKEKEKVTKALEENKTLSESAASLERRAKEADIRSVKMAEELREADAKLIELREELEAKRKADVDEAEGRAENRALNLTRKAIVNVQAQIYRRLKELHPSEDSKWVLTISPPSIAELDAESDDEEEEEGADS